MIGGAHPRDAEYILVIERDDDTREAVSELVSSCEKPVHSVTNWSAAAKWIGHGQRLCAVVVACGPRDCEEVREFIAGLRKQEGTERALVVVLSTLMDLPPFDAGTVVLRKPFDGEKLIEIVCGHC